MERLAALVLGDISTRPSNALVRLRELDNNAWVASQLTDIPLNQPPSYGREWCTKGSDGSTLVHLAPRFEGHTGVPWTDYSGGVVIFSDSGWKTHIDSLVALAKKKLAKAQTTLVGTATAPKKPKRSTTKGAARTKIISAITLHHQYANGGCQNFDPIGVNKLANCTDVSPSSVSAFLKKEFGGYDHYRAACNNSQRLAKKLKSLNQEYCSDPTYGGNPPETGID